MKCICGTEQPPWWQPIRSYALVINSTSSQTCWITQPCNKSVDEILYLVTSAILDIWFAIYALWQCFQAVADWRMKFSSGFYGIIQQLPTMVDFSIKPAQRAIIAYSGSDFPFALNLLIQPRVTWHIFKRVFSRMAKHAANSRCSSISRRRIHRNVYNCMEIDLARNNDFRNHS